MKRTLLTLLLLSLAAAGLQASTVAVTGDVADWQGEAVADLILAEPSVEAVLLAGDTDNSKKTDLESFRRLYSGAWGRLIPKIRPAPGNHESYAAPPFSGYKVFWGTAAHAPEMYYSFDLDGWHVVSLDSVAVVEDGAAAQLAWLKKDLAAHPGKPVLAFWHYPYFSRFKHGGERAMKPFWEALYVHGPALVMNGHNHAYERYAPMDPGGKLVGEAMGIRQFVVGPGGAKPTKQESKRAKGPAPERSNANAQHVGFFDLRPDGSYRFTVRNERGVVVDSGAGRLIAPKAR
ncbi:MAG TPA: hypothetical protein DCM05_06420 [Elusimicrobia bacterium]|nr:hypothetical protein [Elusimicrobiota bacterium]